MHLTSRKIADYRHCTVRALTARALQTVLFAAGRGQVAVDVMINGHKIRLTLSDVLQVPGIKRNLFSIGVATDRGVEAKLGQRKLKLFRNGTLIAIGRREGNDLYCMDMPSWICTARACDS